MYVFIHSWIQRFSVHLCSRKSTLYTWKNSNQDITHIIQIIDLINICSCWSPHCTTVIFGLDSETLVFGHSLNVFILKSQVVVIAAGAFCTWEFNWWNVNVVLMIVGLWLSSVFFPNTLMVLRIDIYWLYCVRSTTGCHCGVTSLLHQCEWNEDKSHPPPLSWVNVLRHTVWLTCSQQPPMCPFYIYCSWFHNGYSGKRWEMPCMEIWI